MNYSEKLATMKANPDILLKEIGDEWRTPDDLFLGINQLYGPFVLDLFTDGENAKCATYYTAQDNALAQPWAEFLDGGTAFANPPYSRSSYDQDGQPTTGMRHIVAKAMEERDKGARVVLLIKAAPSESWWPEHADHVCWIKGRVGFELPLWAQHLKASSAGFGQAIVVFDKNWRGERERYIARDVLERQGQRLMNDIEQRAEQLAAAMVAEQVAVLAPALSPELKPLSPELEPLSPEPNATVIDEGTTEPEYQEVQLEVEYKAEPQELPPATDELKESPGTCEPMVEVKGAELEPEPEPQTEFTPEELHQKFWSRELSADDLPTLIVFLVGMFGVQEKYNIKQVQIASVAASGSSIAIDGLDRHDVSIWQQLGRALTFNDIEGPSEQVSAADTLIASYRARLAKTGERRLNTIEIRTLIKGLPKGQLHEQQAETNEA